MESHLVGQLLTLTKTKRVYLSELTLKCPQSTSSSATPHFSPSVTIRQRI